jgi:hypothetical protein
MLETPPAQVPTVGEADLAHGAREDGVIDTSPPRWMTTEAA